MTTTDTTPEALEWWEHGYNHGAARKRALLVVTDIVESLDDYVNITGVTINYKGTVDVHIGYDEALTLVANLVGPGSVEYAPTEAENTVHHHWLFEACGVPVDVVAVVSK